MAFNSIFWIGLVAGVVQEPTGKVAQAWTQRHERGCGRRCRLQVFVQPAVQRTDAAVRRRGPLRGRLRPAHLQHVGG